MLARGFAVRPVRPTDLRLRSFLNPPLSPSFIYFLEEVRLVGRLGNPLRRKPSDRPNLRFRLDGHKITPMIEIKTRLQPADLAVVDRQAAALGITRAELVRRRVTGCNDGGSGLMPADYHRLVVDASRFMRGAIDRTQVEILVAYVIRRLDSHLTAPIARHQPPA